jgi:hypothetical protein
VRLAVTERVRVTVRVALTVEVGVIVDDRVAVSDDVAVRVMVRVALVVGVRDGVRVALAVPVGLILIEGVILRVTDGDGQPGTEVAYWLRLLWQRPQCIVPVHRGFPQIVGITQAPDSLLVGVTVANAVLVAVAVGLVDLEGEKLGVIDADSEEVGDTVPVIEFDGVSDAVGVGLAGLDGLILLDELGDRDSLGERDADLVVDGLRVGERLIDGENDGDTDGLAYVHVTWTGTLL